MSIAVGTGSYHGGVLTKEEYDELFRLLLYYAA